MRILRIAVIGLAVIAALSIQSFAPPNTEACYRCLQTERCYECTIVDRGKVNCSATSCGVCGTWGAGCRIA